jgi:hypothetical protein
VQLIVIALATGFVLGASLSSERGGESQPLSGTRYYPNCAAARSAGMAPLSVGEPGYRDELDRDGDGIACEPLRRR